MNWLMTSSARAVAESSEKAIRTASARTSGRFWERWRIGEPSWSGPFGEDTGSGEGANKSETRTPSTAAIASSLSREGLYFPLIHSLTVDGSTPAARASLTDKPRRFRTCCRCSRNRAVAVISIAEMTVTLFGLTKLYSLSLTLAALEEPNVSVMRKSPQPIKRRVRVYLAQHDMTQQDLADQLLIAPSHLSSILAGRETPSLSLAVAIEQLTGIPARDFITMKDKPHEHPVAGR